MMRCIVLLSMVLQGMFKVICDELLFFVGLSDGLWGMGALKALFDSSPGFLTLGKRATTMEF